MPVTRYCERLVRSRPTTTPSARGRRRARGTRTGGLGYNRQTAADADSSAWAIRFLTASRGVTGLQAEDLLGPFVAPSGRACTFQPPERFGRWAEEHDEVTPMVGLAYLAAGVRDAAVAPLRRAAIETHERESCWRTFWWAIPAYAAAVNLEFLAASGGIPDAIAEVERARLLSHAADSPLEWMQCLAAASHLRASESGGPVSGRRALATYQ